MVSRKTESLIVFTCLFVMSVHVWYVVRNIAGSLSDETAGPAAPAQVAQAPPPPPIVISEPPSQPPQVEPDESPGTRSEIAPLSIVAQLRASEGARSYAEPREVTAMNNFLWGVFPYLCILLFFVVPVIRMVTRPFSWSTRASGLFGRQLLGFASVVFHWGLLLVALGHFVGLIGGVLGSQASVAFFYWSGLIGGVMVLVGSALAFYRRVTSPAVRAMSQPDDYIVHVFLILIVGLALYQVIFHRIFGIAYAASSWAASLWTLSPQPELMASASLITKLHVLLALTFFAYFPFTKLVHFWTFPINYFVRPRLSMRTQRYRFQRRWELAWRSDKSWLTYGLGAVAAVFVISGLLLGRARPSEASGLDLTSLSEGEENGSWLTGYPLYVSQCARCHGVDGFGDGPGANSPTFAKRPRDLVYRGEHYGARYHFISTENGIASDDDLYRAIYKGLGNSGMPAFSELTDDQILSLIDVLNEFRADSPKPGRTIVVPPDPGTSPDSIARGGDLFQAQCATCHGVDGRGDGETLLFNYLNEQVYAADLAAGNVKDADSPEQIYLRITAGVPGGSGKYLMTKINLSEQERWDLVHYVMAEILPPQDDSD